ncbi:MAG: hypothetical protein ABSE99_16760 [Terracidiphilus sp.]|jgi:hypothetical protein
MSAKLLVVCSLFPFVLLLPSAAAFCRQPASVPPAALTPEQAQTLVQRALATELRGAQDPNHPMRYRLRKSSPRLTSTKEIVETRDGAVARLLAIDDKPLSQADEQREQARLDDLLSDPGRQRHRKQNEDEDTRRALKVLHALPQAFLYQFAGAPAGAAGKVERFTFRPNPNFNPPDLETQILTAMTGEIWIDTAQERVTRLEGHLQKDVDYGWGILGRLYKGGWIVIEQADVGGRQWRIVRFQMVMSGRVLFRNKSFDTVEEQTHFAPMPPGLNYRQAIQMLRSGAGQSGR